MIISRSLIIFAAAASLTSCRDSDIENVEAAAENTAAALEAEAANIAAEAENATGEAVNELERQAAALENEIDNVQIVVTDEEARNETANGQ